MALGFIKYIPLPVLHTLAAVCAYFSYTLNLSIYRSIRTNLLLTRPELTQEAQKALAKKILKNQLISTVDSIKSWAMPAEWSVAQIKKVHDIEVLQRGFAHPNGMLLIVPHLGAWELMNPWIHAYGAPTIMYKPLKNKAINNFILQSREKLKATLVPTDASGIKALLQAIKRGGFSVILPDHVPDPSGGVVVPFFGIETLTSTLAPKLAAKTKCALVGLSCIRHNDGYEVFCYDLADERLYDKDATVATAALNRAMQQMIEPHFSHYMWGYRRFKATPLTENPYILPDAELQAVATALQNRTANLPQESS